MPQYGAELGSASYPDDNASVGPYPFYDRWSDAYNVTTEFIAVNQARSLMVTAFLAARSPSAQRKWTYARAEIVAPKELVELHSPVTLRVKVPGEDLALARIVWEARDQEPAFGPTYTISPKNSGMQWVETEVEWPDGRRAFAADAFAADSASVSWIDGSVPAGAVLASSGGDQWLWSATTQAPRSGSRVHQSSLASGLHEHSFAGASSTLKVNAGDHLFAWVYLDSAHPPAEIMLSWNDGSSWEHRAYWGTNTITYGRSGSAGRYPAGPLPAAGKWVQLKVSADSIGLEGATLSGMCFSLVSGSALWGTAGRSP
jgi:hypothetical protein